MPLVVACLCAEWCSSCREYRDTFDRAAKEFADVRFLWLDVEDQSDLVGHIDVETFPMLLIGSGDEPRFFGPLTPQPEVLVRLVQAHLAGTAPVALDNAELRPLLARLRALPAG